MKHYDYHFIIPKFEQEQHEKRITDLAHRKGRHNNNESRLDAADLAYELWHDAGAMRDSDGNIEDFEYPSVRRERLYRETIQNTPRPKVAAEASVRTGSDAQAYDKFQSMRDPEFALKGVKEPWAILEYEQDNDTVYGGASIVWLACESKAKAVEYCEIVGWDHEQPGPGEYDGVYTYREVHKNPHSSE